ncbi:hypothetical protein CVT24_006470 [Panaeolus cyanescens]|uniref:Purine-cytosine permease n=1 Tax=Panaeolus cyanescens TaxID=181874 RepID=A0A409VZ14_9AGAR|nr:hypothetical protein CVT24_006470 [Panaeolus cyanescens]
MKTDLEANTQLQAVDVQSIEGTFRDNVSQRDVPSNSHLNKWAKRLYSWGIEARGSQPVPEEERVDMQFSKLCWVFFSSNFNILGFSVGTLGPVAFQLSVRDSYWGAMVPCLLNFVMLIGFGTLTSVLGGQTLASVSDDRFSWTVGIVIFVLISLIFSFCGYTYMHWFERFAWVPVLIAFLVAFGVGGKHLGSPPPPVPPTASSILGFAGVQAGFVMTWSGSATDFGSYLHAKAPSWKIFFYAFAGIGISTASPAYDQTLIQSAGVVFVVAAQSVPEWSEGYAGGNIGGLLNAVLAPAGNFGKFLTVLLSLSVSGSLISIIYSASLGIQILIPALSRVPRYFLSVAAMGIMLPLAIAGAHRFYDTITNFIGLIGYWASAFSAIVIIEHVYFRSNNPDNYDLDDWNVLSRLPPGIAAMSAGVLTFGLVVPCMGQALFTGPIAKVTGDIGFEVALILSALLYFPFRWLELRMFGR